MEEGEKGKNMWLESRVRHVFAGGEETSLARTEESPRSRVVVVVDGGD